MFHRHQLQQRLPLAVLKRDYDGDQVTVKSLQQRLPLAVLKRQSSKIRLPISTVATALTACGIETTAPGYHRKDGFKLQQRLPLAVLKRLGTAKRQHSVSGLQQRLPLAVLKLD